MSDFFRIFGMANRAAMQGARLGMSSVRVGKNVAVGARNAAELSRSRARVGQGVLGPGDPPPPPGSPDFFDYRGIVTAQEVGALDQRRLGPASFRLGSLVDVHRGNQLPIGLPMDVLRRHAAVVGPAGSGKTAGVLVPWIDAALRGGSSVVAVDVKGDLLEDILASVTRHPLGPLGVPAGKWDFTDPTHSISWDWIGETRDDAEIDAAVTAILGREDRAGGDPYFHRRDSMMLRGLLRFLPMVTKTGYAVTAGDLLRLLSDQQRLEYLTSTYASAPGATDLHATLNGMSSSDYPRAISGVTTALGRLDMAGVAAVTQPSSFKLTDLFARPTLLVVAAPMKGGESARFLSSLFLNLLAQRLYRRFGHGGTHVFLFVDEAARVVDRFNFEEVLSISRSAGVSVCLATQDVAQFKDENERSAVFSNCATYVSLAGASPLSAKLLGERLGKHRVSTLTLSRDPSKWGSSTGRAIESVPVLGDREITQPPFGPRCAIAHVNAAELGIPSKPMLVNLSL
jgi:type IV secretory pathway TraG/TraD family ATPase VirD4